MRTVDFKLLRLALVLVLTGGLSTMVSAQDSWTSEFDLTNCQFETTGSNRYFILEPGYQLVLEGADEEDSVTLVITVLNETEMVDNIETRVVEERESVNGELIEVSRNFFAFCKSNGSVFYFGEDVDMYEDGEVVSHEGAWRAGVDSAHAGVMMPGLALIGASYYQEVAPGIAMDRARIIRTIGTITSPAGEFGNCLVVEETSAVEPNAREQKAHAPGIGLVQDESLLLVSYGMKK